MNLDKNLRKYLKRTGKSFAVQFIPEEDKWCVMVGESSTKADKLADALRSVWLEIPDFNDVVKG
ncbi:hypothetical protein [Beggiatoa leptomitoformis]|uniref:Uncharacterized protein n=1 Tax=Beggiatoa leptomitoformis TaxID=288004 RepID=A0A2N9YF76_9GAMM|nr:hypothetical protein [Beggiatoa leptomitoformis]ALG68526.1 hypothetical protein AL038_13490 [Beggiatoa leptomitoformis]AUI69132.1 hypothetical protein BLE401_10770 [Beggiatoa leptomitoformis]